MAESPFYRFYRRIDFPLPWKTWEKLPRLPSYKNEYWDGRAHYTPRPRTCDAYLDLSTWPGPPRPQKAIAGRDRVTIRRLREGDWSEVADAFHGAFAAQPPLSSWNKYAARRAARCIIEWTRLGRDGPLVHDACFTAWTDAMKKDDEPDWLCGAAIITLVPAKHLRGAPTEATVPHSEDPNRPLLPHLNWIFVNQWLHRHGIGTALLESVVAALRAKGLRCLASTCLQDNAASLMWHWRNGFRLPPDQFVSTAVHVEREE